MPEGGKATGSGEHTCCLSRHTHTLLQSDQLSPPPLTPPPSRAELLQGEVEDAQKQSYVGICLTGSYDIGPVASGVGMRAGQPFA
jgi:hypothetical protein